MSNEGQTRRLSDYVFSALEIALEQKDLEISELLTRALEQSMTRNAGGRDFTERREFTEAFEKCLVELQNLRKENTAHQNKA